MLEAEAKDKWLVFKMQGSHGEGARQGSKKSQAAVFPENSMQ